MHRKPKFAMLLSLLLLLPITLAGCGAPAAEMGSSETASENTLSIADGVMVEVPVNESALKGASKMELEITVGGQVFTAVLEDNPTARAFYEHLPLTADMTELNGNEKYYYLENSLPTDPATVGKIHSGDLMLYGSDCLVLFYQDHDSNYSYTRLGTVADPDGLAQAVGNGSVTVTWEKA